jgi:hypothetical protein
MLPALRRDPSVGSRQIHGLKPVQAEATHIMSVRVESSCVRESIRHCKVGALGMVGNGFPPAYLHAPLRLRIDSAASIL